MTTTRRQSTNCTHGGKSSFANEILTSTIDPSFSKVFFDFGFNSSTSKDLSLTNARNFFFKHDLSMVTENHAKAMFGISVDAFLNHDFIHSLLYFKFGFFIKYIAKLGGVEQLFQLFLKPNPNYTGHVDNDNDNDITVSGSEHIGIDSIVEINGLVSAHQYNGKLGRVLSYIEDKQVINTYVLFLNITLFFCFY